MFSIDLGGVVDMFTNESRDQATAARDLSAAQFNKSYQQSNKQFDMQYGLARDQFDYTKNELTNRVNQAKEAGISPLAALGISGTSPVSLPQGSSPSAPTTIPYQHTGNTIAVALDFKKKLAEAKLTEAQAAQVDKVTTTIAGQEPTTQTELKPKQQVTHDPSYIKPGLESALRYMRGPGGSRIPVSNAEIEEIIGGWIIDQFGKHQSAKNSPYKRGFKRIPDRTGRFDYLEGGDTIAP